MKRVLSDDVYNLIYDGICQAIKDDATISALVSDEWHFDFEPSAANLPTLNLPAKPKDLPRLTVVPVSNDYPPESTCGGRLVCVYDVQLTGFHIRNRLRNKIAWRLTYLFRHCPFTCVDVDGIERSVVVEPGIGTWDYDSVSQRLTYNLGLTVTVRL